MKWFPSNIYAASDKCTVTFLYVRKAQAAQFMLFSAIYSSK